MTPKTCSMEKNRFVQFKEFKFSKGYMNTKRIQGILRLIINYRRSITTLKPQEIEHGLGQAK